MSYLFDNKVGFVENAVDAFNRLKVSNPFTLFDSQHRYQENDKWDTVTATGGSKQYILNESAINLSVTTTSGSKVYRETKRVFSYQPGKSLLILNTFAFATPKANLRQRIGYFSSNAGTPLNGVYLEQNGTQLKLVVASQSLDTNDVFTEVNQSEWNGDKFDGTGASGRTLDVTKANIFWIDIEWLGVGDVRCGFFVDGKPVVAHTFHNDNINRTTYMTTACLPIRYEIENTGTTSSSSTMKQICSSIISDGGYQGFSKRYNVTHDGATLKTLTTAGTSYPIIAIRLNPSRLDSIIVPSNANVIVQETANNKPDTVQYRLLLNPTVTDGSWTTHFNGNVQYNNTATSVSGGTDIIGGYVSSQGALDISGVNDFNFQLGRTQAGVSDVLALVLVPINDGSKICADISWYEII